MPTLTIEGQKVKVDDSFLSLSPEEQSATVEEIAASLGVKPEASRFAEEGSYDDSWFAQVTSGGNRGMAALLGTPVDLTNLTLGGIKNGVNAAFGTDFQTSEKPVLGSEHIREMMGGAIKKPSSDPAKRFVSRVAEEVGASAIPTLGALAKAQKPLQVATQAGTSALASGVGAATAQQVAPDNPTAELIGQLAGGLGAAGISAKLNQTRAQRAIEDAVPTVDDLKENASELYQTASKRGVKAPSSAVKRMSDTFDDILDSEGVTIGGDVNGYEKLATIQKRIRKAAQDGDMTVAQMQAMRKSIQKAAASADPDEARMGMALMEEWREFVNPMAPEIRQADKLYHRAMKASQLDTLDELADSKTGQFTGSGRENALRTEYRGLERALIKGKQKGYSPEELAAISRVSRGTPVSNTMSAIGRLKPTGPMSAATSVGLPGILGTMIGGPMLGVGLAAGTSTAGHVGRRAAEALAQRHTEMANLLVRNGAPIEQVKLLSPDVLKAIAALLTAQFATQLEQK